MTRDKTVYDVEEILSGYGETLSLVDVGMILKGAKLKLDLDVLKCLFVKLLETSTEFDRVLGSSLLDTLQEAQKLIDKMDESIERP